ncbi:hypothetical protein EDB83DRAFT_2550469 [Lactarius deliciosus]|nr:hypothetical protein EDB83DRAFT_2550469 [Lactarius deliciosus]
MLRDKDSARRGNTGLSSSGWGASCEGVGVNGSPWRQEPRASEDEGDESGEREGVEIDGKEQAVASRCDRYGKPAMRRWTETESTVISGPEPELSLQRARY